MLVLTGNHSRDCDQRCTQCCSSTRFNPVVVVTCTQVLEGTSRASLLASSTKYQSELPALRT